MWNRAGDGLRSGFRILQIVVSQGVATARVCLLAVMAAACSLTAVAGVNLWTTSGPRTEWSLVAADPRPGGAVFIETRGRSYRSIDQGSHWSPVSVVGLTSAEFEAFWFDPDVPHRIYAAVDTTGGLGSSILKAYRSDDDGATWTPVGNSFAQFGLIGALVRASRFEVSATDANRMYALTDARAISYSADAGHSWTSIGPSGSFVFDFALDRAAPDTVYGAGIGGVFRSSDSGATWQSINTGLPADITGLSIVVDPTMSQHLLLTGRSGASGSNTQGLYTTNNGGSTWASTGVTFADNGNSAQIVFDPGHSSTIYARSGAHVVRSDDGGANWQLVTLVHGAPSLSISMTATGTLYATASNYGFLRSDDQGATWLALNQGLPGGQTRKVGAVAANHFTLFGLVRTGNSINLDTAFRRGSDSNLWLKVRAGSQELGPFGASARNSGYVLAGAKGSPGQLGFVFSNDAGVTWQALVPMGANFRGVVDSFVFAPDSDANVYAIGELVPLITIGFLPGAFAHSHDGGSSWQDQASLLQLPSIDSLAGDPSDPNIVYAGTGVDVSPQRILRSTDAGGHWNPLPLPAIQGNRVSAILVNPNNSQQIVAAFGSSHKILVSVDAGQTWTSISDGLTGANSVNTLAADWAQTPPVLFAGTDQGIFNSRLSEANGSWSRIPGSDALAVNDLRVDRLATSADRLTITAATDSGVWEYTFDASGALAPVYRFYNTQTGAHFYTASNSERDHVLATWPQFVYEGVAFFVAGTPASGTIPIHRFYNTQTGAHFYTASVAERDKIIATLPQFVYEGSVYDAFSDAEPGTVKLYRFFNSQTGAHFYTTQDDERDAVDQHLPQFVDEGVVYNVYPGTSQQ